MCAIVQHECIPQAILGMDVVCQAKSGMGKTAVFVLATLQQLEPVDNQVMASINYFAFDKAVFLPANFFVLDMKFKLV